MNDILIKIDTYLSAQPWWVIALGTAIILSLLRKRSSSSVQNGLAAGKDMRGGRFAARDNADIPLGFAKKVRVVTQNFSSQSSDSSPDSSSALDLDEATSKELQDLLRKGDKIGAIKLIRGIANLDLVAAKNIIEGMSKLLG